MSLMMDLQELIELAILDAMGLLDEGEQARFEMAFRAAPPAVQAQVRREQTRLSQIEMLLPDVEAPAGLRAAVVDAVRREIAASVDLEPIQLPMLKSRGVSPLWRATALGFMVAAVTFGVMVFHVAQENQNLSERLRGDALLSSVEDVMGPRFARDVLVSRDTSRVVLTAASANFRGNASLFVNPEWGHAKFIFEGIVASDGRKLSLAIVDETGKVVQTLREFDSQGGLDVYEIDLPVSTRGQIAVVARGQQPGVDEVLCRAAMPASGA